MKRFVVRLLLLLTLLLPIMFALNWFGVRAGSAYKDGAALVCEAKRQAVRDGRFAQRAGKTNVLFFGTSRMLAGLVPSRFDALNRSRTASLNLGLPALTIDAAYLMLRDWLAHNPSPQVVVLQLQINRCRTCTLVNYYLAQGLIAGDLPDLALHARDRSVLLNWLFPFRIYKYFAGHYISDSLVDGGRIRARLNENRSILERMIADGGYYFIREQALGDEGLVPEGVDPAAAAKPALEYDPFADPFVARFFDLTARKKIPVLLVQPAYRQGQYVPFARMPRQYAAVLARYAHVRVATHGWQLKLYPERLFSDRSHLRPAGASEYTRALAAEFAECFAAPAGAPGVRP